MIRFVLGSAIFWALGLVVAYAWDRAFGIHAGAVFGAVGNPAPVLWILVLFPPPAAWLTAEVVNLVSPRRLLDPRAKRPARQFFMGMLAGAIGFGLAVAALPITEDYLPDWVMLVIVSSAGMLILSSLLPRVHLGHCLGCDYDLRTLPAMDRCPECGRVGML